MQRTIQLWLEDKPGALMRVAGTLTAPGIAILSLRFAPDHCKPGVSRMTIVAEFEPRMQPRAMAKLNRLIDVLSAIDVTGESGGARPATRRSAAC